MKILVTGSKGFLGKHMVKWLVGKGDIDSFDLPECDILDFDHVKYVINKSNPDVVFHFAGLLVGSYALLCKVNVLGSLNLYENIYRHSPAARVIVAGSAAEYGFHERLSDYHENIDTNPASDYGRSKLMQTLIGERYFQLGLNITVARIFNIIGVGLAEHLVVPSLIKRVVNLEKNPHEKKVIKVGNINNDRDFITVETLTELLWFLATKTRNQFIVNACSGEPFKTTAIIEELQRISSIGFNYEIDPELVRPNDNSVVGDTRKLTSLGWTFQNERQKVFNEIYKMFLNYNANWGEEHV